MKAHTNREPVGATLAPVAVGLLTRYADAVVRAERLMTRAGGAAA